MKPYGRVFNIVSFSLIRSAVDIYFFFACPKIPEFLQYAKRQWRTSRHAKLGDEQDRLLDGGGRRVGRASRKEHAGYRFIVFAVVLHFPLQNQTYLLKIDFALRSFRAALHTHQFYVRSRFIEVA